VGSAGRRGIGPSSGSLPPSRARRLALPRSISAFRPRAHQRGALLQPGRPHGLGQERVVDRQRGAHRTRRLGSGIKTGVDRCRTQRRAAAGAADAIAEPIATGFRSDELAAKKFVRAEIAALGGDLPAKLHREMDLLSWKMAGMLLVQAGVVTTPTKLL
jgi:hypothetical protein